MKIQWTTEKYKITADKTNSPQIQENGWHIKFEI